MLKIVLFFMAGFSGIMAMHIDVMRTYFWLNENKKQNIYLGASPLEKDGEYGAVSTGSEDLSIEWFREVVYENSYYFWPEFTLDYGDLYPKVFTGFDPCVIYKQYTIINFAQDFFNKILANYSREYQCPLEKKQDILSLGNLQWDRYRSGGGVECDTPVTVTLILKFYVSNDDPNWAGQESYTLRKSLEAIYEGEFTDC